MNDELRAATERLRQHRERTSESESPYLIGTAFDNDQLYKDERAVITEYMRLTDPTLIDEAWLRSFRDSLGEQLFIETDDGFRCGGLSLIHWDGWRCQIGGYDLLWEYMPDQGRGAVRRLASALGIDLKE